MIGSLSLSEGARRCPACGSAIGAETVNWDLESGTFVANGRAVKFPPAQARVFDVLWRARLKGSIPAIGDPENKNSMAVHIHYLRRDLRGVGYSITKNRGNPPAGFRLIRKQESANG